MLVVCTLSCANFKLEIPHLKRIYLACGIFKLHHHILLEYGSFDVCTQRNRCIMSFCCLGTRCLHADRGQHDFFS